MTGISAGRGENRSNWVAQHAVARQRRAAATEPGQIDARNCPARPRASADRARFRPRPWLPGYFRERRLAVKAAPAAGLEQFGEVFQPLLGKGAPARDDVAAACHVDSMCHEPARKEKKRTRTQPRTNQPDVTVYSVENFRIVQCMCVSDADIGKNRGNTGCPAYSQSSAAPAWPGCADFAARTCRSAETKDPSGGTTGRVKPYGRLGWMGARAEYSLDGEGLPLPPLLVAEGSPRRSTGRRFF